MRNRNNDNNIARSKSINDIGKPPAPSDKLKVKTPTTYSSNGLVANAPNNTNTDAAATATAALSIEDDNGNRPSVAEMRRKFDPKSRLTNGTAAATDGGEPQLEVRGVRIAENRFIKQDSLEGGNINRSKGAKDAVNGLKAADGIGKEEQQRPAKHFKLEVDHFTYLTFFFFSGSFHFFISEKTSDTKTRIYIEHVCLDLISVTSFYFL